MGKRATYPGIGARNHANCIVKQPPLSLCSHLIHQGLGENRMLQFLVIVSGCDLDYRIVSRYRAVHVLRDPESCTEVPLSPLSLLKDAGARFKPK